VSISSLVWQGLLFSGSSIGIVLAAGWWLHRSPLRRPVTAAAGPSPAMAAGIAGLLSFASLMQFFGAYWDASQHRKTGLVPAGADFLWPPHILIYSGFLATLVVALLALAVIARPFRKAGVTDPRHWVRANPSIGAVCLASVYGLFSIPGDAIWHALFGIDLTAWSPPHLLIGAGFVVVVISAALLLLRVRPALNRPWLADLAGAVMLGQVLAIGMVLGVTEWEYGSLVTQFRPAWFYPFVGGVLGLFALGLARRMLRLRWAATAVAVVFLALRGLVLLVPLLTGDPGPRGPLLLVGAGLLVDLVPWERIRQGVLQDAAFAALFTAGFALPNWPWMVGLTGVPAITWGHLPTTAASLVVAGLVILPATRWVAARVQPVAKKSAPAHVQGRQNLSGN
jgi:hypothetical protein